MKKTIALSDKRKLGYAEYGSESGNPVFYFHTHPGSRIGGQIFNDAAEKLNIHVIAPERPGCGLSEFKLDRTIFDWRDDVAELADQLGIETFAVLGASGGGPYAVACAYTIPERVTKTGLLASVGPMDVPGLSKGMQTSNQIMFWIAKRFPKLVPYMLSGTAKGLERPEQLVTQLKKTMLPVDVKVMDEYNLWGWFVDDLAEAFRAGIKGPSRDVLLYSQPWGFSLESIQVPVYLWHGEDDSNAPLAMAKHMAEKIPYCEANYYSGLGHLSVIITKAEEALRTLGGT